VTLLGPRQCGKTTLAKRVTRSIRSHYFDLENPADEARLTEPMTALEPLEGLIVIDEVQRAPALFPVLRVLADRPRSAARFLLLGSASPELVRASSESLAGRVAFVDMSGFGLREVGAEAMRELWIRADFLVPFWRGVRRKAPPGGATSSARSWNATCIPSASMFRRVHCAAFGQCWPIVTGKRGTPRRSGAL
jgi:predicted AAA+ superfamily ATPase